MSHDASEPLATVSQIGLPPWPIGGRVTAVVGKHLWVAMGVGISTRRHAADDVILEQDLCALLLQEVLVSSVLENPILQEIRVDLNVCVAVGRRLLFGSSG
jgi:hypothetical protein